MAFAASRSDFSVSKEINTVSLMATTMGEPIYLKSGFESIMDYTFLKRENAWENPKISPQIKPFNNSYYKQLIELDKKVCGENREKLIEKYLDNCLVYIDNNQLKGYYLPFLGEGPIYAIEQIAGIELMKVKYATADYAIMPSAIEFLEQNGFVNKGIKGKRMVLGEKYDWKPMCLFSHIGGNYGLKRVFLFLVRKEMIFPLTIRP